MQELSFVGLPEVDIAVGATTPVPPQRANGDTGGYLAWSTISLCVIAWSGAQWNALSQNAYSGNGGISTTSGNVTTTST